MDTDRGGMTLNQLEAFVVSARTRTFASAAAELSLSQAAISDLTRRLEKELGAALFRRETRTLSLTQAGLELLPHAEQAVEAARAGRTAIRSLHSLEGGVASFGVMRNEDYYLGGELALHFQEQYPSVTVRLFGQNSAATAAAVAAGRIEAALIATPVDDDELCVLEVARDEILYVSRSADRLGRPHTIEQITAAPLVLYDASYGSSDPARRQLARRATAAGVDLRPVIEVEHLTTALDLVVSGAGDSIMCRSAASTEAAPRGLRAESLEPPMFDTLAFVKRQGQQLTAATSEMVRIAFDLLTTRLATTGELLPVDDRAIIRFLNE